MLQIAARSLIVYLDCLSLSAVQQCLVKAYLHWVWESIHLADVRLLSWTDITDHLQCIYQVILLYFRRFIVCKSLLIKVASIKCISYRLQRNHYNAPFFYADLFHNLTVINSSQSCIPYTAIDKVWHFQLTDSPLQNVGRWAMSR